VCDEPLDKLPKFDRKALERAEKALKTAVERMNEADAAAGRAETDKAVALKAVENAVAGVTRCEKELADKRAQSDALAAELKAVLKSSIADPRGEIDRRSAELRSLIEAEDDAEVLAQQAERELQRKELAVEKVTGKVTALRAKLSSAPLDGLFGRAGEAAPQLDLPQLSLEDLPEGVQDLATIAGSAAKELQKLADDLTDLARSHVKSQERLLERARAALPETMSVAEGGLGDLIAQCRSMTKQVASEAARAEAAVKSLQDRLKAKAKLETEIDTQRAEHVLYAALGKELKSDRIVQFLQVEALSALALAGSRHLSDLSSTRYRLEFDDDKFFVVDAWNGDEKRSVKTLSGGETFLASLALALALSEQVQLLAVTERSRMESLFLDEGFGTLDAETLDVVIGGVRALAGEDRLVGVVTHVPELAEAIPVRLQVSKSMRGSTVTRVLDESFVA
jgi:exonuclease SbcC